MKKTVKKDAFRLIKHSQGRYISLILIVAIGTAFFTGVTASSTMMSANVDAYNDANNLKDLTVYSNYGFDTDDIAAIEQIDGVKEAEGSAFVDVIASYAADSRVTRIHRLDKDSSINQFILKEGRMPEKDDEVLAEKGSDLTPGFPIGSVLHLTREDGTLKDSLSVKEVTVVGLIDTPLYLNEIKENSTLSNRSIQTYLYMPSSAFLMDYDIEVNIVTEDGKSYNSFYKPYEDYIANVENNLSQASVILKNNRKDKIYEEASQKYEEGLVEYEKQKALYEEEISSAEKQLEDAENQLANGRAEWNQGIKQLEEAQRTFNQKKQEAESRLQAARDEFEQGKAAYASALAQFEEKKTDLASFQKQIQEGKQQITDGISSLHQAKEAYATIEENLPVVQKMLPVVTFMDEALIDICEQYPAFSTMKVNDLLEEEKEVEQYIQEWMKAQGSVSIQDKIIDTNAYTKEIMDALLAEYGDVSLQTIAGEYPDLKLLTTVFTAQAEITLSTVLTEPMDKLADKISIQDNLVEITALFELYEDSTIADLQKAVSKKKEELREAETTMLEGRTLIIEQLAEQNLTVGDIDSRMETLQEQYKQLEEQEVQIVQGIQDGESQLNDAKAKLESGEAELLAGEKLAREQLSAGQNEIFAGWKKIQESDVTLRNAEAEILAGRQTLEEKKKDAEKQFNNAKAELDAAKDQIDQLEEGEWTILNRSRHYASETYKSTVQQMKSIADIFPVFFLFVAALVCLTTISRMVDEERGQIGIMRALGYTPVQCAMRYLIYSSSAAVIGVVIGSVIGMLTFPRVIYEAWKMMYVLPDMKIYVNWKVIAEAGISFLGVLLFTTWITCHDDMKDVPAQLLRPKAPKLGKSTMIEKVGFIWKRLSFTWKVTIRNLLRYKKRLVMTCLGVAGCTALLITGFGVKDSIQSMVDLQFEEIMHYDGTAVLEDDVKQTDAEKLVRSLEKREDVDQVLLAGGYAAVASSSVKEETVNAMVFENDEEAEKMMTLRTRKKHEPLHLSTHGVIISEKLSENLEVHEGDTIVLEGQNGVKKEVVVENITEMYIQHYVLMEQAYYEEVFDTTCSLNTLLIDENQGSNMKLQSDLVEDERVDTVNFFDAVLENFQSMVKSLDFIVWVLIISSMSLAFVVLGNLTNINISERQREIATLKVLGFHGKEVQKYIYKENNILTLLGALLGIPVGNALHHWIMRQVEMDYVMFGRSVMPASFVYSIALTIAFGLLVNHFMKKKLKNVEMVESLKSVE